VVRKFYMGRRILKRNQKAL